MLDAFHLPGMGITLEEPTTLTVETPTASENIIWRQFAKDIVVVALYAVSIGGTSVTIDPEFGPLVTSATKLLTAAEVIATANTAGEYIGGTNLAGVPMLATFANPYIAAGNILRLKTSAISGTPTQLSLTLQYRLV